MATAEVLWAAWDGRGLEHLRVDLGPGFVRADSLIIARDDAGRTFRARYAVECDGAFRVRHARIELLEQPPRVLDIRADGFGHWTDAATGVALPLDGCIDIDVYPSPFTNTLPIRRLADAEIGRPAAIDVAYVALPDLAIHAERQEYTLLGRAATGTRWRFRSLDADFTAELPTDPDGLVLDYPGIARRLPS